MKRTWLIVLMISSIFLSGCTLPSLFRSRNAALQITTNPKASVYLNNEKVGETPFSSQELKNQDYDVRLVPEGEGYIEWETSVTLYSGITTVITYDFAKERQQTSGSILTLEPISNKDAVEIAIISIPDNASVKLDGQPKGFTPLQVKNIEEGEHALIISSPGYKQEQLQVKTVKGHKLTLDIQLAKELLQTATESSQPTENKDDEEEVVGQQEPVNPTSQPQATSSAQVKKPYAEILETPTGWLRVRSQPSTTTGEEIAKVNPGEKYPFLETNDAGWHKITLSSGKPGWISGRYAKIVK